jgi:aryl sulfotransferase
MNAVAPPPAWPRKVGEIVVDPMVDSARWNGFEFRDDDIVIATYAKSGTTLTQQVVSQLVFDGDPAVYGQAVSPWLEARPMTEALDQARAQTHRRFLKTHLPLANLVFSPRAKYLFVARDPRDVAWSFHNHLTGAKPEIQEAVRQAHAGLGLTPPPVDPDVRRYYHEFLDGGAQPPYWPYIQGWWDVRHLPNVLLIHYADLIGDMPGQIRRIAAFLDIPLDEARLPLMVAHCSIAHMRKVAADDPLLNLLFSRGAETFINKGTNGRWRDILSQDEIDKADRIAARELTPDCAAWLRNGGKPA